MDQKDIEKIVHCIKNIEPDVDWIEIKFSTSRTNGEIVFKRDENNELVLKLTYFF